MKNKKLKLGLAVSAMALYFAGCGDDVLYSQEGGQFSTVNSLGDEKCSDETEGSMVFLKSKSTMYVCSEGEWIAMNDHDAIQYRCESKELKDKSGFAIVCDGGDTIGVVHNGKDGADGKNGANGKDGVNGKDGANGKNGANGANGTNGSDGTNGSNCTTKAVSGGIELSCPGAEPVVIKNGTNGANGKDGSNCTTKAVTGGIEVSCPGADPVVIKNGSNGTNGKDADMDKIQKDIDSKFSSASAKQQKDIDDALANLSSASAKNQKDVDDALKNLSSASAKNQKDVEDALNSLSSATDKFGQDINNKFNDAYSSWNAELEDKSCAIVDTVRDNEKAIITVTIRCGEAETKMEIPFTPVNENLAKVYKKHVVVRFPVQANKETKTGDIYEEIWKNLKGGDNAELSVTDLDANFNATGKLFIADLFADASKAKSFVTIEETNEKIVEYKVVRLEGDLDVTNLTTPIAQFRVKLNLKSPIGFSAFGGFGSNGTDVIYNAIVDLTDVNPDAQDASDTVVIDFLTDYKAARVKSLLDKGNTDFATASAQANQELADALFLEKKGSNVYPTFETYLPTEMGLEENFNSVVWVMALIDQKDKTPGFNVTYNAYRDLFAKYGNLFATVKTTYAGREQDMFFVDFIALLIDANFVQWDCMKRGESECDNDRWKGSDAVFYKIVQEGFVHSYGLTTAGLVPYAGYPDKLFKSDAKGGYFRYFTYDEARKIWWPLGLWAAAVATVDKVKCDATTVDNTFLYSFEGLDDNAVCTCENDQCYWEYTDNVCLGRNKGDKGTSIFSYEIEYHIYTSKVADYECVEKECNPSASSCAIVEIVPSWGGSSSSVTSSSSEQEGRTPEELANDPSSKLYLGTCDETKQGSEKPFNINNAELATTTGYETYVCDGSKWRLKTEADERYGTCTKSMMKDGVVKALPGSQYMKCDYLDNENKYEWIATDSYDAYAGTACHYGNVDKNLFSEDNYYICVTAKDENGKIRLDNKGNHIHEWRNATADDYCVGDHIVSTTQKVADENLGELTFNEKCEFQSSVYVRNKTAENSTEWISNWTFAENNIPAIIPAMGSVYVIFMEGYTDNELFSCANYCDHYSIDRVKSQLAVTSSSSEQQELLNIICNMGEYKRVSAGAYAVDTIAFEVEVQLAEAEIKKTYVASAKRNDWHVATLNDILGECNRDKMSNQSSLSVYDGTNYKCDFIESSNGSYYTWRKASELDADATLKICTYARDGEIVKVNDMYYECEAHDISSSASRDWSEYSESGYLNKNLGECNIDNKTTSYRDIKNWNGHKYKCSVHDGEAEWVYADEDSYLGKICDEEGKLANICSSSYVCVEEYEDTFYQWRKATIEEYYGKCDANKMHSQSEYVMYYDDYYKCGYDGENYVWVDASIDNQLGILCSYDMAHADTKTVANSLDGTLYICDELSSSSTWIKTNANELCENNKEPLKYNRTYGNEEANEAISASSFTPCSGVNCAFETEKYICRINGYNRTLSYLSEDGGNTWKDVQTYCSAQNQYEEPIHALNNACEFANNKWAKKLDTLYRVYEQTEYYVYNVSTGWKKATDAQKYCNARFPGHGGFDCVFEGKKYYWCESEEKWLEVGNSTCITR